MIAHPTDEFVDIEPIVVQDPLSWRKEVQPLRDLARLCATENVTTSSAVRSGVASVIPVTP